jgi:hypothetical protein
MGSKHQASQERARPESTKRHKLRGRMVATATVAACLIASAPAAANGGGMGKGKGPKPTVTVQAAVNGGFENPDIATGTWAIFSSITGWTPTNGCGIELQDPNGNQYVELNSNCPSGITQTLQLPSSTAATVSFDFSPRPGTQAEDNKMDVYWNGTLVKTVGPQAGASDNVWSHYSVTVMSKSTAYNGLKFVSAGTNPSGGGVGVFLDHVEVNYQTASGGPGG